MNKATRVSLPVLKTISEIDGLQLKPERMEMIHCYGMPLLTERTCNEDALGNGQLCGVRKSCLIYSLADKKIGDKKVMGLEVLKKASRIDLLALAGVAPSTPSLFNPVSVGVTKDEWKTIHTWAIKMQAEVKAGRVLTTAEQQDLLIALTSATEVLVGP